MKGIITAWAQHSSWGFIQAVDEREYFYHLKNCPGLVPRLGAAVEFETAPAFRLGKPDQAVNVRIISGPVAS
jgi:cold shock CspA family protein